MSDLPATGQWAILRGILDNVVDCSPEEIADEIFQGVTVEQVRRVLAFAGIKA